MLPQIPTGGTNLHVQDAVSHANAIMSNAYVDQISTGVPNPADDTAIIPATSTIVINTCYRTLATASLAETVVCTKSAAGLYLPVCPCASPTVAPTFATTSVATIAGTTTCYSGKR